MAYRQVTSLEFADFHTVCLSGENGAGKSTLLDAMTWALWGKARVGSADDLIHLGESSMEVEFTFELATERYRVLRRRSTAGRGKSELHFHTADAGGWRTLTENSIRLTQDKIDRLLRIDYDTFINSAFLLQGRADEFTARNPPKKRKEILAEILDLRLYDEYERRTADYVRHYREQIKDLEGQIRQLETEMAGEGEYRRQLATSQEDVRQHTQALREAENKLNELRLQRKTLASKREQCTLLQERLKQDQADLAALQTSVRQGQQRVQGYQVIIERRDELEAGYQQLQEAQTAQEDWEQRLRQSSHYTQEKHALENHITKARHKLETELTLVEKQQLEVQQKASRVAQLNREVTSLDQKLKALQETEQNRNQGQQTIRDLDVESAHLEQHNQQLKEEMNTVKHRLTQLTEATSVCPVCTQPLTELHRQQVKEQFEIDGKAKGDTFRTNRVRLQDIQKERKSMEAHIQQAEQALRQQNSLQRSYAAKQNYLQEAQQAQEILPALETQRQQLRQQLAENQVEPEAVAKLRDLDTKLQALAYDAKIHNQIKAKLKRLQPMADQYMQLQNALTHYPSEQERLQADQDRLQRLRDQTAADQQQVADLQTEIAILPQLEGEMNEASADVDRIEISLNQARRREGAAQQMLTHIAQQGQKKGEMEDQLIELRETQAIYQELRTAFGKKGVQAMLIEQAIPELEDEANAILARMTDGRMHLRFLTQKQTKSTDNTVETLDISIADEIGTRPYELYSGGEAFRVNFAIRIALSKFLARRAGARLQTLVIDEGFGTQDASGRENLIEAITKIEDEFEKIIIITHIDELKDAFPKRVNVYKTVEGSQIQVI